jgi:hypothetical protein
MSTTSQQVLDVLGRRIGTFQIREIHEITGLSKNRLQSALRTLTQNGYAERRGRGHIKATAAGLALLEGGEEIKFGPTGPRMAETERMSLRCRLWKALRLAQKGSISDFLELAARGSESDAFGNAKEYLNALVRSGHVMRLTRNVPLEWPATKGESRYCLMLNTGPQAPQYNRRRKRVFDPNTGETHELA